VRSEIQEAVIGIGTNVANREAQIHAAMAALEATKGIESVELGPIIDTEPVVPEETAAAHPRFLNTVAVVGTTLSPEVLMSRLLAIEASFGRGRDGTVAPRTLDLDLLLLGDQRRDVPGLTLPHPRMWERPFVLEPLEALRPGLANRASRFQGR
jgi:2-amino-4-hydroxy-6-hydroxymethyldihydropteridine diphosphokinase